MNETTTLSTARLRDVLAHIEERGLELDVCPANDVPGPGGGVYITRNTPLSVKHLDWLESRSPSVDRMASIEVRWVKNGRATAETPASLATLETRVDDGPDIGEAMERAARQHSRSVASTAREVADQATGIYRTLGQADFTVADLRKPDTAASLRQFEASFVEFHGAVKKALGEYLHGNTLVMDLILKYQLDRETVRHALSVAAFATEMATQLALRQGDDNEDLRSYFGDASDAELLADLGLSAAEGAALTPEERNERRLHLFREELVEVFLGGFMHDCGLWTEPFFLPEGHEVKGAKLISEVAEVRRFAPSLAKIVLFHSDIVRLARKHGLIKITDSPDEADHTSYRREFYDQREDAVSAAELSGNARADVLSLSDLRKVLPVALAEHFISHTRDVYTKPEVEVINDLAQHIRGGPFQRYMVVLCNSRVEVVAPKRALVRLEGHLSVMVEGRKDSRRAVRLEVDGFDAGSLVHGSDRNSPHLITLFLSRRDGSRVKADYVSPYEHGLWDRAAGTDSRMYIAAGRYRNNLSFRVTGFMGEEVFARVLGEYEQEFLRRNQ